MKKRIMLRGIMGFPLGVAIGYFITILLSLIWGQGYYSPCVPELTAVLGNEPAAVLVQAMLCGLLGMASGASSVIWKIEGWSIVKQTGIYFGVLSGVMLPIAYLSYWMEHSVVGFLQYFAIFFLIFCAIWGIQFVVWKRQVGKMNAQLKAEAGRGKVK